MCLVQNSVTAKHTEGGIFTVLHTNHPYPFIFASVKKREDTLTLAFYSLLSNSGQITFLGIFNCHFNFIISNIEYDCKEIKENPPSWGTVHEQVRKKKSNLLLFNNTIR